MGGGALCDPASFLSLPPFLLSPPLSGRVSSHLTFRLYPRFSLIPLPLVFLSPLSPVFAKEADGTCDPQSSFPRIFPWGPRLWFSEFLGFLGFVCFRALFCFALNCIAWSCSASHLLHVYPAALR